MEHVIRKRNLDFIILKCIKIYILKYSFELSIKYILKCNFKLNIRYYEKDKLVIFNIIMLREGIAIKKKNPIIPIKLKIHISNGSILCIVRHC